MHLRGSVAWFKASVFRDLSSRRFRLVTGEPGEKPRENHQKSGRFWPVLAGFSNVPAADTSVSKPKGARSQTVNLPALTSVESGCLEPLAARRLGDGRPLFTDRGRDRHVEDGRDFTIALILSRGWEARAPHRTRTSETKSRARA